MDRRYPEHREVSLVCPLLAMGSGTPCRNDEIFLNLLAVTRGMETIKVGTLLKASVYIETSVFSYLTARPSNDLRAMANQSATSEWWETQRPNYSVFISDLVISEAGKGHIEAAQRRLDAIANLPLLEISPKVRLLAQALIENHALPPKAEADAYHVAIAVVNGVEYLLTWNCTHIANAHTRPKIEATCRAYGYEPPIICTPLELTEE